MQTLVSPSCEGFVRSLASMGPVVSEMFKECGRRRPASAYVSKKSESSTNHMVSALYIVSL